MLREPPLVENATATSSGAGVRDELPEEDHVGADVVGDRRDVGRLHRQRDRRHGAISRRRRHAVERPVVGIGGRAAIAEQDQLAAALQAPADGVSGLGDGVGLLARHLVAQRRVVGAPSSRIDAATSAMASDAGCLSRPRNG